MGSPLLGWALAHCGACVQFSCSTVLFGVPRRFPTALPPPHVMRSCIQFGPNTLTTPTHSSIPSTVFTVANTVSLRNVPTFASLHHPPRPQMARSVIQRCPDAQNTHFTPMLVLTWRPRLQRPRLKRSRIWLSEQPVGLTFIAGQSFGICK